MFGPWPFVLRRGEEGRERNWKRGVSIGGEGGVGSTMNNPCSG